MAWAENSTARDLTGWKVPTAGTMGYRVYDLFRSGMTSGQIAVIVGRKRSYVSAVLSQLKPETEHRPIAQPLTPEDARSQCISAGVKMAYAQGRLQRGARFRGRTFELATAQAKHIEEYWHKLGYQDVVCEVADTGLVTGKTFRVYKVVSNLVNGVPPRRQLVAAE